MNYQRLELTRMAAQSLVRQSLGFTLLELMMVLLLVTLLLAMAVPSYQQYMLRVHRATAIEALLAAAGCQQQVYAERFSFDTRRCLPGNGDGNYNFRMDPPDTASTTVFTVIATPLAAQQLDRCKELILDQSGWRSIGGPEELQRKCWEGR
ncbi:MAG TPA: type IV pilin protein [Xanthomonadales bacterium]|nr:type IV pilin protein [Xanthomonadales bacterium]